VNPNQKEREKERKKKGIFIVYIDVKRLEYHLASKRSTFQDNLINVK